MAHYLTRCPDFDAIQKGAGNPPAYHLGLPLEQRSQKYELDLNGVPAYQGGDLPSASPLVVGTTYIGQNPYQGFESAVTPSRDLWFDTDVINGKQ